MPPTTDLATLCDVVRRLEARVAMLEDRVSVSHRAWRVPVPELSPEQQRTMVFVVVMIALGLIQRRLAKDGA